MKYFSSIFISFLLLTLFLGSCQSNDPETARNQLDEFIISPSEESKNNVPTSTVDNLLTNFEREMWQKPNMVINRLGSLEKKVVADIGAGYGYFAFRLLREAKKVLAIDIDTTAIQFMDKMTQRLPEELQGRLEARLCPPNDPNLKKDEADIVIMVNTYIYIEDRINYLKTLQEGMTKNAQLLIIDFKMKNIPFGPPKDIRVPLSQVEQELEKAGFQQIQADDTSLDYQYIVTASRGEVS